MKKNTIWILMTGDLLLVIFFVFFYRYYSSNPPRPWFDFFVAFGPWIIAWLIVSNRVAALNFHAPSAKYLYRSILTWFIAGILAEISRCVILLIFNRTRIFMLPTILDLFEGAFLFIAWRTVVKLVYSLTRASVPAILRKTTWSVIVFFACLCTAIVLLFSYTSVRFLRGIHLSKDISPQQYAIVLGAGVWPNGTPAQITVDRVSAAVDLYHSGKTQYIILSGDKENVTAMYRLALLEGVQAEHLILDEAGYRTYSSCFRAKNIFHVDAAVVISQKYHLPRALLTCNALGVKAVGVSAQTREFSPQLTARWYLREIPAICLAWWEIKTGIPALIETP